MSPSEPLTLTLDSRHEGSPESDSQRSFAHPSAPSSSFTIGGNERDIAGIKHTFFFMQKRKDRRMREGRFRGKSQIRRFSDGFNFLIVSCIIVAGVVQSYHTMYPDAPQMRIRQRHWWAPIVVTLFSCLSTVWSLWKMPEHIHSELLNTQFFLWLFWMLWEYVPEDHKSQDCYWEAFCFTKYEQIVLHVFATTGGITVFCWFFFVTLSPFLQRNVFWKGSSASWWYRVKRDLPDGHRESSMLRRCVCCCCRRYSWSVSRRNRKPSVMLRSHPGFRLRSQSAESQDQSEGANQNPSRDESDRPRTDSLTEWQTFSYLPFGWQSIFSCWHHRRFRYQGAVDEEGKPHGFGRWHDNHFHGESLLGLWAHAAPTRGFRSRAFGTSAQTSQRPIAYATPRADWEQESWKWPQKDEVLRYGVAQVELSHAGGFFSWLPCIGLRETCASVAEMKQKIEEGSCASDRGNGGEALVFIHGFNASIDEALGRLGQLLVLGGLSKDIDPFVFSYSAGSGLTYFQVKAAMPQYGDNFATFLNGLGCIYSKIHILTHSCGAHFLFTNWLRVQESPRHWTLGTLTMLNPDVIMEIAEPLIPSMVEIAELFTIYIDENDQALYISWFTQWLLPRWVTLQRLTRPIVLLGATLELPSIMSEIVINHCEKDADDYQVDIINCSDIEQNVHNLRHCYYMLNTQMVADICEVISEGTRASTRQRLVSLPESRHVLYTFACPPGGYHPD